MPDELESDLLGRFVQGDPDAFESLFRRFQREVYGWALRIVRRPDLAEAAVVEAFWRAYRARARFDSTRSFGAWIRRIAVNAARDQLKAARRDSVSFAIGREVAAPAAADGDVADAISRAFDRLPMKLRMVATLALVEDVPLADIGDALDIPLGTVKSRLFRAIRALRKELARQGIQP